MTSPDLTRRPMRPQVAAGLAATLIIAVVACCYWQVRSRYFASEDFLLIRTLLLSPPWSDLAALVSKPWMDTSLVQFYRPVATLMFGCEVQLFGTNATAYNLTHIGVHAVNSVAVFWLCQRLLSRVQTAVRGPAFIAALLFAIYPLHANAILFLAGFATLFAGSFQIFAILSLIRFFDNQSKTSLLLAAVFAAAAIGCYEAAVIVPVVAIAAWILLADASLWPSLQVSRWRCYALFVVPARCLFRRT